MTNTDTLTAREALCGVIPAVYVNPDFHHSIEELAALMVLARWLNTQEVHPASSLLDLTPAELYKEL